MRQRRVSIPKLKDVNKKNEEFGLSLMLSNVPGGPMSPKFINGTYAALFEDDSDELYEYAKNYRQNSGGSGSGGGGEGGGEERGNAGREPLTNGGGEMASSSKGKLAGMLKQMSLDMEGNSGKGDPRTANGGVNGWANGWTNGGGKGNNGGVDGGKAKEKMGGGESAAATAAGMSKRKAISKQGSLDTKIEDIIEGGSNKAKEGSGGGGVSGGGGNLSPSSCSSSSADTSAATSPNVIRAFGGERDIQKTISKEKLRMRTGTYGCPACGHGLA